MGDAGHHWVGLCPKPRSWSWFGGCPRLEAQRVSPTTDENSIYMYTVHIEIHNGERESGGLAAVNEQQKKSYKPRSHAIHLKNITT